jgi:hypothetical protein
MCGPDMRTVWVKDAKIKGHGKRRGPREASGQVYVIYESGKLTASGFEHESTLQLRVDIKTAAGMRERMHKREKGSQEPRADLDVWRGRDLVRQVRVGPAVEQQPHHVEVAIEGGSEEAREPRLRVVFLQSESHAWTRRDLAFMGWVSLGTGGTATYSVCPLSWFGS